MLHISSGALRKKISEEFQGVNKEILGEIFLTNSSASPPENIIYP
jgi:hypothetical protein